MRELNLGVHQLGPGGYRVAEPIWDKEDAERAEQGLPPCFEKYGDKHTRNYVRARYKVDPVTKELTTDAKTRALERVLGAGADVPCTLLHFMGGELIDVAKGRIVQPGNPMFHGKPMPPTTYRVQLVRVLPGCDDLLPPFHPAGADIDDVMTLSACLSWPLLWPKSQIRLGAGDTTPQTTPPVVPAPSHGKTAATLPDMHMAQDPDMHMA
ncbi:hypothetical protein ZWY2020_028813 [Hordeum vulgare]|nr:hypothetical protein ZWY2020_028813 [Hordeum vulgare]